MDHIVWPRVFVVGIVAVTAAAVDVVVVVLLLLLWGVGVAWGSTVVVGVGGVRGAKNKLCNQYYILCLLLFLILVLFSARIFLVFVSGRDL